MWRDLTFAARTLRRNPTFTIVATLSLALGIGATTAIFSLMDQVLLRLLPVRDPQSLVLLHREYSPQGRSSSDDFESVFSYPMYQRLRDQDPAFSGVVARSSARVALTHQGGTEPASAEIVSGNFFQTLGVGATLGRVFTAEDDLKPGAHPVVVLSSSYWTTRFASDRAIIHRTVTVNGQSMNVIGVAAMNFNGIRPGSSPDLYVPISMQKTVRPTWDALNDPLFRWLNVFARLKPGTGIQQAQAATDVAYKGFLEAEVAGTPKAAPTRQRDRDEYLNHRLQIRPASQGINGLRRQWEKPLVAVMAMVALVLLITCANVVGLMLARAAGRQKEIAIRLSLGAGRAALVKQLLTEGLVLFLAASVFGLIGAIWSSGALISFLPEDLSGNWLKATLDWRVLAFNTAIAAGCGLLFGLIPALQATRPNLAGTLKDLAAQTSASGGGAARWRKVMVTVQVAFSLMLLFGAGLFAKSLFGLMKVDLGYRSERLLTFNVDASTTRPDRAGITTFYRELQTRIEGMGNVVGVGASDTGPFSNSDQGGNITVEGYRAGEDEYTGSQMSAASPGFFRALGIPLRAGREFTERDDAGAPKVVVVNEAFVKKYFGSANPIGRRLMFGGSNKPVLDRQIVGVVADSHKEVREKAQVTLYYPYMQSEKPERLMFYVRTAGSEATLAPDIRKLVRSLDPNVPMGDLEALTVRIQNSIYTDRLIALLATAFGALATILAAIGLYGVVGYAVTRRTAEIGLRIALGAMPSDVMRMVLGEAARMVLAGIVIGVAGGIALGRLVQSQLFGIQSAEPGLVAVAMTVLVLVTIAAASIPAWRAARISPITALKYE